MAMLHLEEGFTPRSAAHMAMLNLEDSSLMCRVSSLEERCKEQEEEVAELKAGLANALNRIAVLEGEKKHSFQVFFDKILFTGFTSKQLKLKENKFQIDCMIFKYNW